MSDKLSIPFRNLSSKAGIQVSELCLGGATWRSSASGDPRMPASTPEQSQQILDLYLSYGGNFIDVANVYQGGESEEAVGQWLSRHQKEDAGFRGRVIIATKYGLPGTGTGVNDKGASRNHIFQQVEASLKRLQTDYIDLYIQHCWDERTPIEETLLALNDLIRQGKVRYIGASNFTSYQLLRSSHFAQQHGLSPFVSLQNQYSLLCRSVEWDIAEVAQQEGVGLMPWSPLAGGWLSGKYTKGGKEHEQDKSTRVGWSSTQSWAKRWSASANDNDVTWQTLDVLQRLANKYDVHVSAVAIRWLLHRPAVTSVVIGPRTVEQLQQNAQAAKVQLTAEEVRELNKASSVEMPYPYEFIAAQSGRSRDD
jgi:aryl-alcohol dehydrogenase-like predicted oxidoreductase